MNIVERIEALRLKMKEHRIDAYMIPSADFHQSEYVGEHFKSRAYVTGFTGSAGTAIITQDIAGLWTDGRYFIQAEQELAGSNITLYKSGNPGVDTIEDFLATYLPPKGTFGVDGRLISMKEGLHFQELFSIKNISIIDQYDLVDMIWEERPSLSDAPVFLLNETYTGESTTSKLGRVRNVMKHIGATTHLITTLDDIAWLLNIRGRDVACMPVVLCYAVVEMDAVHLFIEEQKLSNEVKDYFLQENIILHPYNDIYMHVSSFSEDKVVLIDPIRINYALYRSIPTKVRCIEQTNPCVLFKAVKNKTEQENIRQAHLKDAIAHTKFLYWLKTSHGNETITELSASDKLEAFRREQDGFLWPSFEPISAHGPHAAMCHYSSSEETNVTLTEGTFYLTDTGGHYLEGSTDITRTIALGAISTELKRDFTNVLKGNLALSRAIFPYGCSGKSLDVLARQFLWQEYKDYNHGTGHGVGYLLSIHEPSCRFHWRSSEETLRTLEEGMIITDEPGLYIEDSHGIRIENELMVQKCRNNDFGQFMHFEVLTYVPIDLDAIDISLLSQEEKDQLNDYHKKVYELVAPHLNKEEQEWLSIYTRAL